MTTAVRTSAEVARSASVNATVIVSYTFSYLTPVAAIGKMFGSNNFGSAVTLTATGVMPCET